MVWFLEELLSVTCSCCKMWGLEERWSEPCDTSGAQ